MHDYEKGWLKQNSEADIWLCISVDTKEILKQKPVPKKFVFINVFQHWNNVVSKYKRQNGAKLYLNVD